MTKPVGRPEVSAGGDILFRWLYGESEEAILGPTWQHDKLYKNRGRISAAPTETGEWRYKDPSGQGWFIPPNSYTRKYADFIYFTNLKGLGYKRFAQITYVVNRLLGWVFWYDLNEWPKRAWRKVFG